MGRLRVERSIYKEQTDGKFAVHINRPTGLGQFFKGQILTLEEARHIRDEFKRLHPPQPQTGRDNNAVRSGKVQPSREYNHRIAKADIRTKPTFICNRCKEVKGTKYLNLHHIDHDRSNDDPINFEALCTICHREHHNERGEHGKYV